MTRTGPKGPPLFDVLAPAGRTPSAFELAAQAVIAASQARPATAPPAPEVTDSATGRGDVNAQASPEPATAVVRLRALQFDEEPPLASRSAGHPGASDSDARDSPGPRVSAFAAATGAALSAIPVPPPAADVRASAPAPPVPPASPTEGTDSESKPLQAKALTRSAAGRDDTSRTTPEDHGHGADVAPPAPSTTTDAPAVLGPEPGAGLATAVSLAADTSLGDDPDQSAHDTQASTTLPPAVSDDDDFGPLVLPEEPRRRWRRTSRATPDPPTPDPGGAAPGGGGSDDSPRRRVLGWAIVGVAGVAIAAFAFGSWLLRPEASAAPEGPPAVVQQSAGDVSMVSWHGIDLPVSASAGPTVRGETVSGFSRSPLGAAIAAANLVVRVDPQAGADVFEPVLAAQVVGASQRLADAVRQQAQASPDPGIPATLTGWRVVGDPNDGEVVAHLAVATPDGTAADFAVSLTWVGGDWRINAPAAGPFFPVSDVSGDYTPFLQEGSTP